MMAVKAIVAARKKGRGGTVNAQAISDRAMYTSLGVSSDGEGQ